MLLSLISLLLLAFCLSAIATTLARRDHVLAKTATRSKAAAHTPTPTATPAQTAPARPDGGKAEPQAAAKTKLTPVMAAQPEKKKDAKKESGQDGKGKDKKAAEPGQPFEPGNPLLILEGVRCQVHRQGNIRQDMTAKAGRYDEEENILDLDQLHVQFQDQGKALGELACGGGRVWTSDRPKEQIHAHDMLLQQTVRLQTPERIMLETPEMRYNALESRLWSDKGFKKQLPTRQGYMVGSGDRFDIKLLLDKNTFDYWKEYGNPVVIKKSEKPVLEP